jgi:hypothetical protein
MINEENDANEKQELLIGGLELTPFDVANRADHIVPLDEDMSARLVTALPSLVSRSDAGIEKRRVSPDGWEVWHGSR